MTMPMNQPDYDDPRIQKLPAWARELIEDGRKARKSADYWIGREEAKSKELDDLRRKYAAENGQEGSDTWVFEDLDGGEEARFGLGSGRPVCFATDPTDLTPDFTVTFRDGGLDISIEGPEYTIQMDRYDPAKPLRIER